MKIKETIPGHIFNTFNILLMCILVIITLYPFYYVVVASFTDPSELIKHTGILLYPPKFSTVSYEAVFEYKKLYTGYKNTLIYMTLGTTINMVLTIMGGYALSRKGVIGTKFIMKLIIITMFFGGGLIPTFLLVKGLNMYNTIWAVILPGAISTMNLIIMRTSFQSIPAEMEESAKLDGANDWMILYRIMLPLCIPTIAVLIL